MKQPNIDLKNLPGDPKSLHSMIKNLVAQSDANNKIIAEKEKVILSNEAELIVLRYKLHLQLMARFAAKSEKTPEQLSLFDEAELPSLQEQITIDTADDNITIARHTRKKTGRKPLPKHLPREQIIHDLADRDKVCDCGHSLHRIGEDIREQLEWIPAQVKVIEHVRIKYACKPCEQIKTAPLPITPIPKSIATPGLLAEILVNK